MNFRLTLRLLGGLLLFLGAALLAPIPFSLYYRDGQLGTFLISAVATSLTGYYLMRRFQSAAEVTHREGFAVVTFTWLSFAFFGSLPFLISAHLPAALAWPRTPPLRESAGPAPITPSLSNPIDAFFESMSGFATAGASVITNVEAMPRSVLFWRALTQWLGGMGIIVLSVAVLPLLGVGGMQLFEAEAPGPTTDRLNPRIEDTARLLWGV
jgi:trk system potassium uptake protein TrkH